MNTTRFLRTVARAEATTAAESWADAADLWADVVAINPVEGRFWTRLANARYHGGDFRGAIDAAERALELGDGFPAESVYRIACCLARLGEREPALVHRQRAFATGYRDLTRAQTDDDLASLRDDDRYRSLVGLIDSEALSRDDGWRADLRLLVQEIKRRAYAPFRHISEARFDAMVSDLDRVIPDLTDAQILVELTKLLRPLRDGHARINMPRDRVDVNLTVPLRFYLFEEGLFIIAAEPTHADLLGARVVRVGEHTTDDALAAVDPIICRDNEWWPKHVAPYRLRETATLQALGVIPDPHELMLTVEDAAGRARTVTIAADGTQPTWKMLETNPAPVDWQFLPTTLSEPLPLYLRNASVRYWFEYLPDERVVYVQLNAVLDDPVEPLAQFTDRLFAFIDGQHVEKLVLDLRFNGGGNTGLVLPMLYRLVGHRAINRRGALFVVIGRATFSAAQNTVSFLDLHTEAIFVGEPTGSSPTFVGETVEFELPYSKVEANVSDLLWVGTWPGDYRAWIAPSLYTPPTFAAYRANRDPALEAILAHREHLPNW